MPKRTRAQLEAAMAELQAELDGADTDDEVWIKEGDREFKVTGRRATTVLGRFKDLWEESDASAGQGDQDGDGDDQDDDDDQADDQPGGGTSYFRRRR